MTRKVEAWGKSGAAAERALVLAMTDRATMSGTDLSSSTRLAALGDYWLRTEVDASKRSTNTRQRYRYVVETFIVPGVGGLTVREATVAAMDRYLKRVTDETGAATAKLCKSVLSGMMALAVRHNAAPANPLRDVSRIESADNEVRALSFDEVRALREMLRVDQKAAAVDLPALVDVMLATGARIGEVLALRWDDVDLEAGTVAITGTVVRVKGEGLTRQDTTKGRKVRRLQLPKFAVSLLLDRSVNGVPGGPWNVLFPSATGGLREVTTVERQWRTFREKHSGWGWVSPHTFRKTVGTMIERDRGLADAATQLGHTSEKITQRHYVEVPDLAPDFREVLGRFAD
ncbi:site-specific integrase [Oerskovia sp. Sa1BUA8]|uniref:Site-specific integrase n=1 Tax=Oerskovia douganii TaxID=2762210 RepID=A0A9D5YYR7_9CELL|nr:site-specific integrase [Oerskovia douganii]MBE7699234.1 site-specific integrase [Oerskovia douganii]